MITSDKQILPPSLVRWQKTSHLHFMWVGILFNSTAFGNSFMENSCLSEYIMFRINEKMKRNLLVK